MLNKVTYIDSRQNTSKNPKTNIYYGKGFSKFLFQFDLSALKQKLADGEYVLTTNTKHYLHLTNTVFNRDMKRAVDFDLGLYRITEYWDEGVGHSTTDNDALRASNSQNRTTLNEWAEDAIDMSQPYKIIHFETGAEDLHTDITDYVNAVLTDEIIDYGLCLCFPEEYLEQHYDVGESVSFYSKYFNEYYQPYIETIFDDIITDNRDHFIAEQRNSLYLYVTKGTDYHDLDETPIVDILDSKHTPISGLTGITTIKVRKGIYKAEFGVTGFICDGKRFFYDNWSNLKINGEKIPDVKQKFIPKSYFSDFDFAGTGNDEKYTLQFSGIKKNEKIIKGGVKKLKATLRTLNSPKTDLLEDMYCRLYVKEGKTDVVVKDWYMMDKTNVNSTMIDTGYLLPREYYIGIKAIINGTEIYYPNDINFEVVSDITEVNNADVSFVVEEQGFTYTFSLTLK